MATTSPRPEALRIALVLDRFDPALGGLESWTQSIARWLVGQGHRVSVIAFGGRSEDSAIIVHRLPAQASPLRRAAAVAAKLAELEVDIVHDVGTADRADVFQPQTGSRLMNAEIDIATLPMHRRARAWLSPGHRRWRRETGILERRQFADPDRLIAVSGMVRDQIAARYGLDARRVSVIHNGVDVGRFVSERLAPFRGDARARWRLGGNPVFLLVANNFRLKGVGPALAALARLKARQHEARLAIAGAGDIPTYRRMAERLGLGDLVRFLGRVEPVEQAYAAADVGLQPSHYDACSLSTLEALASGLPVVTTRRNGAGELIADGRQGFLVERADDVETLARAMERLLDPDLRGRMSPAARRLAGDHDLPIYYARIEGFYRRRLALRAGAAGGR